MLTFLDVVMTRPKIIFYSANTIWWTHDAEDLRPGPVPLDLFGSLLFQHEDSEIIEKQWLNRDKILNHPSYGKQQNRLRNFMYMHAKNILQVVQVMPYDSRHLVNSVKTFSEWCDKAFPDVPLMN